jgi:carbamoyltransferase
MKNLLGLRLCEHDSNISYFDGKTIHYIKTERIFNKKHHAFNNLWEWKNFVKNIWDLNIEDIDEISIVVDPWHQNLPIEDNFFPSKKFNYFDLKNCTRINHHYAHALSLELIYPDIKNHVVIDGFGDWDQAVSVFKQDKYIQKLSVEKSGSLGKLFNSLAPIFGVTGDTYDYPGKLMGLQSYGKFIQEFYNIFLNHNLTNIKDVFIPEHWINFKLDKTIAEHTKIDWLRTVHEISGNILVKFFKSHFNKMDTIGFTGGVAMNVIWNTKIIKNFPNLKLIPHCQDDGLSLGALNFLLKKNNIKTKLNNFPFCQSDEGVENISYSKIEDVGKALANNKVIAWYQGNGEIGARALGNRSFLFNPFNNKAKEIINKVKKRENYRPFGASVLQEDKEKYFETPFDNPYMLLTSQVKIKNMYGINHVDGTCRYQTVNSGSLYELIKSFKKYTGESIVLNTSLNISGKPIMGKKEQLNELLKNDNVDIIVCGDNILKWQ